MKQKAYTSNKWLLTILIFISQGMPMKSEYPGLLCAIEGADGAGKTTLINNLHSALQQTNASVLCTKEPGGTELGQVIRSFLAERKAPTCLKAESLLFAADRAQHFHDIVIPHLKKGFIILSDRMSDSSLAYQGFLKGLDLNMIKTINDWCMESIQPDLVIYLKIDHESALKRIKEERGLMTKFEEEFQNRMHILIQGFEKLFKNRDNVIVINALDDPEVITQKALQAIFQMQQKKQYVAQPHNSTQFSSLDQ